MTYDALPVWISAHRCRGEVDRFLVNGQTGEVEGTSVAKIALDVVAALAVGAVLFAVSRGESR
jgi:hypothetical protein